MKTKVQRYRTLKEVTNIPLWAMQYIPLDGLKTIGNKTYAIFEITIINKGDTK